jgi:hypothetical protein
MRSLLVVLLLGALPRLAHAQAQIVETDAPKAAEKNEVAGWNPFLSLTSTVSLVSNSSVVGQVDGTSTLFGLGALGGAEYIDGPHVFRSTLTLNEAFARTPVVDHFVKTNDVAKVEGLYNYFVTKYFGAYGRLAVTTTLLPSTDVRGTPTSWVDATDSMNTVPLRTNTFRQPLATAFKPFTIEESAGGFADPVRKKAFSLSLRLGVGGRHTFADGVYVNHDDKATPEIELLRLADVHQLGGEAFAGITGKLDNDRANYKAGLAMLLPVVNNDKYNRSATDLTRIAFEGNVAYAMKTWMSIVYSLAITRDPQLFPQGKEVVQVQNTVLLTFQASLVKKREKAKEKTKEELEIEAQKKRADEAEQRAKDAEEKLQKAQEQQPTPTPTPTPDGTAPAPTPGTTAPAPTPTTDPTLAPPKP